MSKGTMFRAVPNQPDFPRLEREVLERWSSERTFEQSVASRQGGPAYVFYDGPPFATGLPHYGHILTSYIKDVVPRFFTMRGLHVPRRWGWDCHGLPVEYEVEKLHGFHSRADILKHGVADFNAACRELVMRYANEWQQIVNRLGRWVDFKNAYRTMDADYMESVAHCFARLHENGLVYQGSKVVPYCFRCQTALSNFEAKLDDAYRLRSDPALTVRFRLKGAASESILAWTTTPWTLPSNVALAVAPDVEYVRMKKGTDSVWLSRVAASRYAKQLDGYSEAQQELGRALVGRHYEPLFRFFAQTPNAFVVTESAHVTTDDGTGVVHLAPAFGEEDHEICSALGLVGPNPVMDDGAFDESVGAFAGKNVLEANDDLVSFLLENGAVFDRESFEHSYPHCWRCDTPLLYRAIPSWFVEVTAVRQRMLDANQKISWVPAHLRDGRFGNWLEGVKDWAVSRNRFWGAPIPVWRCTGCDRDTVVGSAQQLESLSGKAVTDWHRPAIDDHTFACGSCGEEVRRVPEVLDCWFESGSMPYAQVHYPFENRESFESAFPGDFIVEYIAQTRGWFYTMVVLSAALFDSPPFRNAVCHGVILGSDGRKMSKRLKNYPDPMVLVEKHGSDALRIALLSSAAASGSDVRFSEGSVKEAVRRFLLPFWNCLHLFSSYAEIDGFTPTGDVQGATRLDRHLLAETEALRQRVTDALSGYDFAGAYSAIGEYVDVLSTWYVRLAKSRLWRSGMDSDKRAAFETMHAALSTFVLLAAPLMPFVAEEAYGVLGSGGSVHLADWPNPRPDWRDQAVIEEMRVLREAVRLVRHVREQNGIKHRHPVKTVWLSGISHGVIAGNAAFLQTELNAKEILCLDSPDQYVVRKVVLDYSRLGSRLRGKMKQVAAAVADGCFTPGENGELHVLDEVILRDEYDVRFQTKSEELGVAAAGSLVVLVDLTRDEALTTEGHARDLNRRLQDLRKKAGLAYADRVVVSVRGDSQFLSLLEHHLPWLTEQMLATMVTHEPLEECEASEDVVIEGHSLKIELRRA